MEWSGLTSRKDFFPPHRLAAGPAAAPSSAVDAATVDAAGASPDAGGTAAAGVADDEEAASAELFVDVDPSLAPLPSVETPPSDPSPDNTAAGSPRLSSPDIDAVVDGDFLSSIPAEFPAAEGD